MTEFVGFATTRYENSIFNIGLMRSVNLVIERCGDIAQEN